MSDQNDWQSEDWEDFTVSVVPTQAHDQSSDIRMTTSDHHEEVKDQDYFEDMKPVLKKAAKVCLCCIPCASHFTSLLPQIHLHQDKVDRIQALNFTVQDNPHVSLSASYAIPFRGACF